MNSVNGSLHVMESHIHDHHPRTTAPTRSRCRRRTQSFHCAIVEGSETHPHLLSYCALMKLSVSVLSLPGYVVFSSHGLPSEPECWH